MKRRIPLTIACLISSLFAAHAALAACGNWTRLMGTAQYADERQGPVFVIEQFLNDTKKKEDAWLEKGYPDLIAMILSTSSRARVRIGNSARYDPAAKNPDYIIGGRFLHLPIGLRMIIEVKNGRTKALEKLLTLDTPYPDNAAFFEKTANAVREIGGLAKLKFNEKSFDRVVNATGSTRCFENYERGMQILRTYNTSKYDVAAIWFGEAKKADFHSWLGYEGMINLYAVQGLMAKLAGRPFLTFYQSAEQQAAQQHKIAQRPPPVPRKRARVEKKYKGGIPLNNRFLRGHTEYMSGVTALQGGDAKGAINFLKRATNAVPEDAMAWRALAEAYTRAEKPEEAAGARAKEQRANNCG